MNHCFFEKEIKSKLSRGETSASTNNVFIEAIEIFGLWENALLLLQSSLDLFFIAFID